MNRFCSIFSQLLQLFSRIEFQQAVIETQAERHARGFTCWGQFVAMLFCQLGRAHSLIEITGGLRSCEGKLKHLGITAPSRSSLAYANGHRPWELAQQILRQELHRYNYRQVHSTTQEVPYFRFQKALKQSLFREFKIRPPFQSVKDIFCLRMDQTVDSYRRVSINHLQFKVHADPRTKVNLRIYPLQ